MMLPTTTITVRLRHHSCRSDNRLRAVWMPATFIRQQLSRSRNSTSNNNNNHHHNTSCRTNRNYGAITATATAPTAQHPPIRSNLLRGRPSIAVSVLSTLPLTHGHERRAQTRRSLNQHQHQYQHQHRPKYHSWSKNNDNNNAVVFSSSSLSSSSPFLASTTSVLMQRQKQQQQQQQLVQVQQQQQRRGIISEAVLNRMQSMVDRHDEIMEDVEKIPETAFTYGKELASLSRIMALQAQRNTVETETTAFVELLEEAQVEQDRDLEEECQQELFRLQEHGTRLDTKIRDAILPNDEQDVTSDAIVEIRPGTGGEEASMFAAELKAAYEQTTKSLNKGWTFEVLHETKTDLNGIKESVIAISSSGGRGGGGGGGYTTPAPGDDEDDDDDATNFLATIGPYGLFRYESGVHRVQRVPRNDTRIHTSACSVAVLPSQPQQANTAELLPMSELKVETMRSSGAGGQHVNCTDSAVRITHVPTGLTASIQDERSQHKNRAKAMKLITARVLDVQQAAREAEHATTKSNLLGSGDRSERIRTYNYPQDRISDHRCKHTTYGIAKLFQGTSGSSSSSDDNSGTSGERSSSTGGGGLVAEFYPYLRDMVREEQLAALEQEEQENKNKQITDNTNTNTKNKKKKKR